MKNYRVLCNDCLRGPFLTREEQTIAHDGESACVCGSHDMCACRGCLETLKLLEQGCRDHDTLGVIHCMNLDGWTAENGAE
jgi:hypothetical protein